MRASERPLVKNANLNLLNKSRKRVKDTARRVLDALKPWHAAELVERKRSRFRDALKRSSFPLTDPISVQTVEFGHYHSSTTINFINPSR